MKLNKKNLNRIIDDLTMAEKRDNTTISRSDYTETSRRLARERQAERGPLLTRLRMAKDTAEEVEV